jgi:NTF2 fold immunity protein
MRSWITTTIFLLTMGQMVADDSRPLDRKPAEGFVPDAKTAIKVAVAVWEPIYGEQQIAKEKPYRAKLLTNTVWKVEGSLPEGIGVKGGVATAFINKTDGKVVDVYHTK